MADSGSSRLVSVPRNMFTYWHQGWTNMPPVVEACTHSLRRNHPGWKINALDADSVIDWLQPIPIPDDKWLELPLAHRSDIIRTQLLVRYGGVWADPTVWFAGPIDRWLDDRMGSGLFVFSRPGRDRLISNWFISAQPGNPLLTRLYEELCRFWRENDFQSIGFTQRRSINLLARLLHRNLRLPQLWLTRPMIHLTRHAPYMVYHYLFAWLVRSDPECEAIWKATPRISADVPHRLIRHGLLEPMSSQIECSMNEPEPPLFKLTWKLPGDAISDHSVLGELFRREGLGPLGARLNPPAEPS